MRLTVFLLSLLLNFSLQSQIFIELATMPEAVSNNAVTAAVVDGKTYVYSFTGIDATKSCDGDHLKAFRYDVEADTWETLPDVPDVAGGKIAASANTVKGKIYVTGGYHLSPSCGEVSSAKIHVFDPAANAWEPDGTDIPVAIDDQVQAVWRDSLIFIVTGWSNTTNVPNVQIYNPTDDTWAVGTPVPNNGTYKVFGAAGTIVGDTLYYLGGARIGGNFPPSVNLRKGYINPDDPTDITWSAESLPEARGYRPASATFQGQALWFGGSDVTYNFDGLAYSNNSGVPPLDRVTIYNPATGLLTQNTGWMPALMDLRGIAQISENQFILAGGMLENQTVSDKTFLLTLDDLPSTTAEINLQNVLKISPNPVRDTWQISAEGNFSYEFFAANGEKIKTGNAVGNTPQTLSNISAGIYNVRISQKGKTVSINRMVVVN